MYTTSLNSLTIWRPGEITRVYITIIKLCNSANNFDTVSKYYSKYYMLYYTCICTKCTLIIIIMRILSNHFSI